LKLYLHSTWVERVGRRVILFAFLLVALLTATLSMPASGQTTETTTTTQYVVVITQVVVYRFNNTMVNVFYANETALQLVYMCMYETSYTKDCIPIQANIYNGTSLITTVDFTNLTSLCILPGLCRGEEIVNIAGAELISIEFYDNRTGKLLYKLELPRPPTAVKLSGLLQALYILLPIAIIGGFAARGSIRMVGIGMILAGIATLLLPYIGIYPPSYYSLFAALVLMGIIILWYSR